MARHFAGYGAPLSPVMAAAILVIVGCLGPDGGPNYGDLPARTAFAEQRWMRSSVDRYQFRYTRSCFCPLYVDVLVTVHGDSIVSVTEADTGKPVEPITPTAFRTVPGWFAFVRETMERRAEVIEAEYDEELGYPRRIFIDYVQEMVDDELGIRIWDLTEIRSSR